MFSARCEVTIKFSGSLPEVTLVDGKMKAIITVETGTTFTVLLNQKSWRKAEASIADFADWAGSISGKLGKPIEGGFEIIDAGIQVFEKKAKTLAS